MEFSITVVLAISTGVAALTAVGLLMFICCCLRARTKQRRQKRREKLERAFAVTPLKNDFYQHQDEDDYHPTTRIVRQQGPPIEDSSTDVQTDDVTESQGATSASAIGDIVISRSQSLTPQPPSRLTTCDPSRRNTLAVSSITPSSSDSSLASHTSEPDFDQQGRGADSEWAVYQVSEKPVLNFSLYHSSSDSTLFVYLRSVTGLARKYYPGCSSFLKVSLLPKFKEGFRTETVRRSLNPHFNESFQFCKITLPDAQSSFLKVKLYVAEKWNRKDRFNGEVFAECHHLLDKGDSLLEFQRTFNSKRTKLPKKNFKRMRSRSTSEDAPNRPYIGDIFVTLQYHSGAQRLKVLVRKAQNLMVEGLIPGTSDVSVSVRLLKHAEKVAEYSTQRRSGTSPIWNQPFLFHPKHDEMKDHSIVLSLIHGRRLGTDTMAGKVEIGPLAGGTGTAHWEEMMEPRGTEVTKWHRIKPPYT